MTVTRPPHHMQASVDVSSINRSKA